MSKIQPPSDVRLDTAGVFANEPPAAPPPVGPPLSGEPGVAGQFEPPTEAELDDMVARYERRRAIPDSVTDIKKWIDGIKADADDVRNKPDRRPKKDGSEFIDKTTDLDETLKHCAAVLEYFAAGKLEVAQSSLRGLEVRVNEINLRVSAPLIATGKKVRDGAKNGGPKNLHERQMAIEFKQARANGSRLSNSALAEKIGRRFGISSRSGAIDAVQRGLKRNCPQTGEEDT